MKVKHHTLILGAVLIAIGMGGCATRNFVRENVAVVDQRVSANQARLDQDDGHLSDLDRTSREALERARAAGKLAEGKFLYSMVLSDDSVKFPVDGAQLSPEARPG